MKIRFMLTIIVVSIFLLVQAVEGQNKKPATGGGTSSKTKKQADEILQRGEVFQDSNVSQTQSGIKRLVWVSKGSSIPSNAVLTDTDNARSFYVCRANYEGGRHPGRIINDYCIISWGGKEIALSEYEIITGSGTWGEPRNGFAGAFVVGNENNGTLLYLCRISNEKMFMPGKVVLGNCLFGWKGQEYGGSNYEVFYPTLP